MSSNKKRRELNRAAEEYDRAKVCSQLAAGNHSMLNMVESALGQEVERLRAENEALKRQVEQGKRDAVPEDVRKDAKLWRAYKKRKDEVIAAGMGKKVLRDAAAPAMSKSDMKQEK